MTQRLRPATARTITPTTARRLAIIRQRLAGPRPSPGREGLLGVARDLGCLQLDPMTVVARSHTLVLWSRVGPYDHGELDALLWEDRRLFEYWAHAASIVLTEDYPIHRSLMRRYPTDRYAHNRRMKAWVQENAALRLSILRRLRRDGPLRSRALEDGSVRPWRSGGWTSDRNVERMLDYLWTRGQIMVVGRPGGEKQWDLAERWLPDWTPRDRLSDRQVVRRAAERSLLALGVARPIDIQRHFIRNRYPGLGDVLSALARAGRIVPVRVAADGGQWPGSWFVHSDAVADLDRLEAGEWDGRTTLLSPFDNLICDRDRTELLFGFRYRMEIYVLKSKRRYGYYVMPILHRDRLIGRIDPAYDRKSGRLTIFAIHAEPDAPMTRDAGRAVAGAMESLGAFLGARHIAYEGTVPEGWRSSLA